MKIRNLATQSRSLFTLVNKIGEIVAPDDKSIMQRSPLNPADYFGERYKSSRAHNDIPEGVWGTMAPGLMKLYFAGIKKAFLKRGEGVKIFMLAPGIGPAVGLMHQKKYQQWTSDPMQTAQSTLIATIISGLYPAKNPSNPEEVTHLLGLAPAAELNCVPLGKMDGNGQHLLLTPPSFYQSYEMALAQIRQLTTPAIVLSPFAIPNTFSYQKVLPVIDEITKLDHVIHVAASGTIFEENERSARFFPAQAPKTVIGCSFDYFGGLFDLRPRLDPRACLNYNSSQLYLGAPADASVVSPVGDEICRIIGSCCASANIAGIIAAYWSQHIGMDNHSILTHIKQEASEREYQLNDQPEQKINIFVPNLNNELSNIHRQARSIMAIR